MITGLALDHYVNNDLSGFASKTESKILEYFQKGYCPPDLKHMCIYDFNRRLLDLGNDVQQYMDKSSDRFM
jgi:hypothetical protein